MDTDEVMRYRQRLEAEREHLEGKIAAARQRPHDHDNGMEDGAETCSHEEDLAFDDNLGFLLAQTLRALQRIDDGSYGRCAECDEPIPARRLEASPSATLCIGCKARVERK
jgi:DnaK suppressor protein